MSHDAIRQAKIPREIPPTEKLGWNSRLDAALGAYPPGELWRMLWG